MADESIKVLDTYVDYNKLRGLTGSRLEKAKQKAQKDSDNTKFRAKAKFFRKLRLMRALRAAGIHPVIGPSVVSDVEMLTKGADMGLSVLTDLAATVGEGLEKGLLDQPSEDKVRKVDADTLLKNEKAGKGKKKKLPATGKKKPAKERKSPEKQREMVRR